MSFFGQQQTTGTTPQKLTTLSVQTSSYGVCMGMAWGTTRLTGNLIWYGDFAATAHTEKMGGKGGGGGSSTNYTYRTAFAMGLVESQLVSIERVWSGKEKTGLAALGFDLQLGAPGQAPWAYLSAQHPTEALNYPDLAYVAAGSFDLGSSASLPNLAFELKTVSAGAAGGLDAAPWTIVSDMLTAGGFPASRLGDLTAYTDWTGASGLFLSPSITEQKRAADAVQEILDITHTAAVASEGVLKLIPYGDTAAAGNGYTFTPSTAPIYDLTDDDFLGLDGDLPIRIKRRAQSDAKNRLRIEFKDRDKEYATGTFSAADEAHIAQYGERPADTVTYDAIKRSDVAGTVAYLRLQRGLYVLNTYEFRLGWRYCLLEPMDVVTLTHALLGMDRLPVRIVDVEEDEEGGLTITAEDFPQGAGQAPMVPPQPPSGYSVDMNAEPGDTHVPVIFKGPVSVTQPGLEVWIAASGGVSWGGCNVWVSDDGTSYRLIGSINGPARHGVLTAALPATTDPDATSTLSVQLAGPGQMHSGSHADADIGNTLLWVGNELITYADATLTAPGAYDLGYLRRGFDQTVIRAHAAGTQFARLDDAIFRYRIPKARVGLPLYVKLPAVNIWGQATQDLADVPAYVYTLDQFALSLPRPLNPTIYCTPDSVGHIGRARVDVSFESVVTNPVTGLDVFVSTFPFENSAHIASGGTSGTLVLSGVSSLSSGTLPVLSGSTPAHIVTTTLAAPNDVTWNGGGRYWARLPGGAWTKCTGIDETGYWFNPPHNVSVMPGSTMEWSEISWADERAGEYQLACIVAGPQQYEVIRWTTLDDGGPGGAVRVLGCERGVEGTTPINADGATLHYLPALGPGTSVITFPDGAFSRSGTAYTAEIEIDLNIPPGKFVSLSAAVFYELPSGDYARSAIVPAIYGGPL